MADITASVASWSTTEASNAPSGGTTVGTGLDDNLRAIQAGVRKEHAQSSDLSAASTIDLSTATGSYVEITSTGTVSVSSLGTVAAGVRRVLRFKSVGTSLTVAHNATSLILPGAANIVVQTGDRASFMSLGSGNWLCEWYTRSGESYVFIEEQTASASATLDFASAAYAAFDWIEFRLKGVYPATDGASLYLRFSTDSGSSYISSSDYAYSGSVFSSTPAASPSGSTTASAVVIAPNVDNGSSASGVSGTLRVRRVNGSCQITAVYYASTGEFITAIYGGQRGGSTYNAFRFLMSSGNITGGSIAAYGVKS